jgi:hypothetical protein
MNGYEAKRFVARLTAAFPTEVVGLFGGRFAIIGSDEPIIRAQFLKAYAERREDELRAANVARYRETA